MRFPLRLSADVMFGSRRIARAGSAWLLRFSPHSEDFDTRLDEARNSSARVVWIGDESSLDHREVGFAARKLLESGKFVFLETDGLLLRRRVHEFQPGPRLYLAVHLHGTETSHDARTRQGIFQRAIEGIRAAKLSGFHFVALTRVSAETDLVELEQLGKLLEMRDADGWLVLPDLRDSTKEIFLQRAQSLIPDPRWRQFSRVLSAHAGAIPAPDIAAGEGIKLQSADVAAYEEGS